MKKVSVLIIAHNEEKNLRRCIESILNQSLTPDEIVLVAHNCSDDTIQIASRFKEVRICNYFGPEGIVHARIKGFEEVDGDIIACIDGDSYAGSEWLKSLIMPLGNSTISGVGGVVYYRSLLGWWGCFQYFYLKPLVKKMFGSSREFYFFGPSFAVRKSDYEKIGGLTPFVQLKNDLQLANYPDDCYLSMSLSGIGSVVLVKNFRSMVCAAWKSRGWKENLKRPFSQMDDYNKLVEFFKKKKR